MASHPPSPRWTPTLVGVGALLRTARLNAGLTRRQLSALAGVGYGQLHGIETELRPPSTATAERLCAVLPLDDWGKAVLLAASVPTARLRGRRGVRHLNRQRAPLPPEVRKRIAAERAGGRSWRAIAATLNEAGVPGVGGGRWWSSSVARAAVSADQ
ncbi:helix-turn-helix domain-containing protein [Streptomyces sp. DI166]|uniref:helix-turn-helix domain-containing protein n=1 Tax=Streptomyces sp. DI166 TaxID=1839783 RepID=UPI00159EDA6C|nr:helix-turn-helix domain-containing protein [Streptomyces sp. DI166]